MTSKDFSRHVDRMRKMHPQWTLQEAASFVAQYKVLPTKWRGDDLIVYYEGRRPRWYDWFIAFFTLGMAERTDCSHYIIYPESDRLGIPLSINFR